MRSSIAKRCRAFNRILCLVLLWPCLAWALPDDGISTSSFSARDAALWQAIERNDPIAVKAIATQSQAMAELYAEWWYLQHPETTVSNAELTEFLIAQPDWPLRDRLLAKAEITRPDNEEPAAAIAWWQNNPPQTWQGQLRFARAKAQLGEHKASTRLIRQLWREMPMSIADQRQQSQALKKWLTGADHRARIGMLIRNKNDNAARDLAENLGKTTARYAETLIAYRDNLASGKKLFNGLPQEWRRDPDLALAIIRQKLRQDDVAAASAFFAYQPALKGSELTTAWWNERHIIARDFIRLGQYHRAYAVLKNHGLPTGIEQVEAEFLAGWLALRHLKQPLVAERHFTRIAQSNVNSLATARGHYWLAIAQQKRDSQAARKNFQLASAHSTSYYGQLARQELGDTADSFSLPSAPVLQPSAKRDFANRPALRVAEWLRRENQPARLRAWFNGLIENSTSASEFALLADWANTRDLTPLTITVARRARLLGMDIATMAYPTPPLPGVDSAPEAALVYAIIRQESSFDPSAQSQAGALGLMQIMPDTGRQYARRLGWDYQPQWLRTRPEYNLRLGQEVLRGKLALFDGNYPLTVAAYNAGPGRVNTWLRDFGDPRTDKISMIDWVELIPFGETRSYVMRVLENMVVYRYLLNQQTAS